MTVRVPSLPWGRKPLRCGEGKILRLTILLQHRDRSEIDRSSRESMCCYIKIDSENKTKQLSFFKSILVRTYVSFRTQLCGPISFAVVLCAIFFSSSTNCMASTLLTFQCSCVISLGVVFFIYPPEEPSLYLCVNLLHASAIKLKRWGVTKMGSWVLHKYASWLFWACL